MPTFHRFKLYQVELTCFLARATFLWHMVTIQKRQEWEGNGEQVIVYSGLRQDELAAE